ncbi:MAG TPA: acyltransferase, partial [Acidimicrobiales bacterium]|nr:acyltransferase [Acidimicrobiales bacterium]
MGVERVPTQEQRELRLPYLPALDGLRGLAVAAVLVYHSRPSWAPGGYLGVTAFFVLSGFLIVGLMLRERELAGRIDLVAFWGRRARRLVPAVLLVTAGVLVVSLLTGDRSRSLVADAAAALGWVANWRFVLAHHSYGDLFSRPSPFQHMWSLAIEEQFYVVVPLVVVAALGRGERTRRGLLGLVLAGVVAASTALCIRFHPAGAGALRSYYGTDTRVAEPAVGALLALVLVGRAGLRRAGAAAAIALDVAGIAALAALALLVLHLRESADALYRGGFLGAALLSAIVVAAAVQGRFLARALAAPALVALGRISYGVYVFHWPIFVWLTPRRTHLDPLPLLALRGSITLVVAAASYALVEMPVRRGRVSRPVGLLGWADASIALLAGMVALTTVSVAPAATSVAATGAAPAPSPAAASP